MKASTYPKLALSPPKELLAKFFYDGFAVYKRSSGGLQVLNKAVGNSVYVTLDGARILAKDLAWALHYGNWPLFDLWQADDNMHNLAISTLLPVRGIHLRCRIVQTQDGWKHALSKTAFLTEAAAKFAWRQAAIKHYKQDLPYCLEQERLAREDGNPEVKFVPSNVPIVPELDLPDIVPYLAGSERYKHPKVPPNARAHWVKNQWVVVNQPKGIWDDYRLRCDAALKFLAGESSDWRSWPVIEHSLQAVA